MLPVVVTSLEGEKFAVAIRTGRDEKRNFVHTVIADVPVAQGGQDYGPTPHELCLAGLAACTVMTIRMVAARKKFDLQGVEVTLSEGRSSDPEVPEQNITAINETVVLKGNLTDDQRRELEGVAQRCPVYKLLTERKTVSLQFK